MRMVSGMPTLPTQCSCAARAISSSCLAAQPEAARDPGGELADQPSLGVEFRLHRLHGLQQHVLGLRSGPSAAAPLVRVHPLVGQFNRTVGGVGLVRKQNHAERAAHRELWARLAHGGRGRGDGLVGSASVQVDPRAEFITAEPIRRAGVRDGIPELGAHPRQERVPGEVTEGVVVVLEAIEVEQEEHRAVTLVRLARTCGSGRPSVRDGSRDPSGRP